MTEQQHYENLAYKLQGQIKNVEKYMALIEADEDIINVLTQPDKELILQTTFSREGLDAITPYVDVVKIYPGKIRNMGRMVILLMVPSITNGVDLIEKCQLKKEEVPS